MPGARRWDRNNFRRATRLRLAHVYPSLRARTLTNQKRGRWATNRSLSRSKCENSSKYESMTRFTYDHFRIVQKSFKAGNTVPTKVIIRTVVHGFSVSASAVSLYGRRRFQGACVRVNFFFSTRRTSNFALPGARTTPPAAPSLPRDLSPLLLLLLLAHHLWYVTTARRQSPPCSAWIASFVAPATSPPFASMACVT